MSYDVYEIKYSVCVCLVIVLSLQYILVVGSVCRVLGFVCSFTFSPVEPHL